MAETNAKKAASGAPKDGQADVAGRNAASTAEANRGQSAEGDKPAGTQMEAAHQSAVDSSVSPKSSTLQRPDAEIRADLTQDVNTANREKMQAEVRAGEGSRDLKKLQALHQEVADAQSEVDAAVKKRDAARDAYDREAEAHAVAGGRQLGETLTDYFAAADKQAREDAEYRRRALALPR